MESQTTFDIPFKMPDFVYSYDMGKKVTLTIKENYQKSSQIIESFSIPANIKLWGDENLVYSKIYVNDKQTVEWNFDEDKVTDSITLYAVPEINIEY